MRSIEELKNDIYNEIHGGTSFVELEQAIEGFEGEFGFSSAASPTVQLWSNMSENAIHAILELIKEKKIHMTPTDVLVYLVDGARLNLPVIKTKRIPKKMHWLPVVFNRGVQPKEKTKV